MSGALSPDGKWMWDGDKWIPAPPKSPEPITNQYQENPIIDKEELSYTPTAPPNQSTSSVYNLGEIPAKSNLPLKNLQSNKNRNSINTFAIEIQSKKWFPSVSIKFKFTNPSSGITHSVKIAAVVRNYVATTEDGGKIGKIKLKGLTIMSGASGNINLSDGSIFRVDMKTSAFGINTKSLMLTDLSTGMIFTTY